MEIKTDNSKVIEQLQRQNAELVARVGRLETGIRIILYADDEISELAAEVLKGRLNETSEQSLAEIQAQAILEAIENTPPTHLNENDYINRLEAYASSLKGKP